MRGCYWLSQKHAPAASHPLVAKHLAWRHARRVRRIRRAAGAAIVCASVSAPLAAAGLPFFFSPSSSSPGAAAGSGSALPESQWDTPISATGTQSIPEPSSFVLLASAVAAMVWRLRHG